MTSSPCALQVWREKHLDQPRHQANDLCVLIDTARLVWVVTSVSGNSTFRTNREGDFYRDFVWTFYPLNKSTLTCIQNTSLSIFYCKNYYVMFREQWQVVLVLCRFGERSISISLGIRPMTFVFWSIQLGIFRMFLSSSTLYTIWVRGVTRTSVAHIGTCHYASSPACS